MKRLINLLAILLISGSTFAQTMTLTFTGQVTDGNGNPLSGIYIDIHSYYCNNLFYQTTTNANGYYNFTTPALPSQQCTFYINALDSLVSCVDTAVVNTTPNMNGNYTFNNDMVLNCAPNPNCNIAWGFTPDSLCGYTLWHQGTPNNQVVWTIYDNGSHTYTQNYSTHQFSGPGSYLVSFQVDNCPIQYDTIVVNCTPNNNNCNFSWGAIPDSNCTYNFWYQGNPNSSLLWGIYDINGTYTSTQSNFNYTFITPGTYVVCLLVDNCPIEYDTIVVNCTPNTNPNCNVAWGASPDSTCGVYLWHQGGPNSNAIWTIYDNSGTHTYTQNSSHHQFTASGSYLVSFQIDSCPVQYDTIVVNCGPTNNCNTVWGAAPDSLCGYYFWSQASQNSQVVWTVYDNNTVYTSTQHNFQYTFATSGTYMVCFQVDNCPMECDTLVVSCTPSNNNCNVAWGAAPDSTCGIYLWHQGGPNSNAAWIVYDNNGPVTYTQNYSHHQFTSSGAYLVAFMLDSCPVQYDTVYVNCNSNNNCQAYFTWYVDSLTGETWVINQSTGNPIQIMWDLGDNTVVTGNNTNYQYNGSGWYTICLTIGTPNTPNCFDTYCDSVYVPSGQLRMATTTTGIEEENLSDLQIYPNPVTDFANVTIDLNSASDINIRVYTMGGRIVYDNIFQMNAGSQTIQVPTNSLSNGMYLMEIFDQSTQKSYREKLIK